MGIGNIANTGMKTAMSEMEVISNNIANASTPGFKRSYASLVDVYPSSSGSSNATGLGVNLAQINQDFTKGGTEQTGQKLDLSIGKEGFFIIRDASSGQTAYIVDINNNHLQGFLATNGTISSGTSISDLQISNDPIPASATANVIQDINLDANASVPAGAFSISDPTTYNTKTSVYVYDSLGNPSQMNVYYIKTAANTWDVAAEIGGTVLGTGTATFTSTGALSGTTGLNALSYSPTTGATTPQALNLSLTGSTQFAGENKLRNSTQDGYAAGVLTGFTLDNSGEITASYSNNQTQLLGQVAIARFQTPEGLQNIGNMSWLETGDSGVPQVDQSNSEGAINPGMLELSNVDLTSEMVKLISSQNNFQANAQVEQTYNEVMKTVIQL
jgi:flagellar hook protein FlgE